jgi:hypothetical protein
VPSKKLWDVVEFIGSSNDYGAVRIETGNLKTAKLKSGTADFITK